MDVKKTGAFLAVLRHEQNLTQEQLGEKLGVTNKTVSRWENGNYLPPVEMLQLLSELYQVSINELLCGERLSEQEYKEKAEENIRTVLKDSAFSLQEKVAFYQKKWQKEHRASLVLWLGGSAVLFVAGMILDNGLQIVAFVLALGYSVVRYNQMMAYVEKMAYDGVGEDRKG